MRYRPAALIAAALLSSCGKTSRPPEKPRTELYLLTALPLIWSERFGLDQPPSPAIKRLEQDYRVTPIDLPSQLPEQGLLLAAQPRALPAEELAALDAWIRRGGRLLLLADPMLEWPSKRPLGDPRRAPMAFPDTGLLQHWGLRLDAPDARGPMQLTLDGEQVLTASPGELVRTSGACTIEDLGLVARCAIDKGRATVVADADLLNLGAAGSDRLAGGNLPALISQLDSLSR